MDRNTRRNSNVPPVSAEIDYQRSSDGRISIKPVRRDLKFDLPPERVSDWHKSCPETTAFFNMLSIVTPLCERYLIEVVHQFRKVIDDPDLIEKIDGLVAQEAIHSREHKRFNALIQRTGLPCHQIMQHWQAFLDVTYTRWVAPWFRLAVVMMLEHHIAAIAAKTLRTLHLRNHDIEPGYEEMMTWHLLEEIEHKSVSFEVWLYVIKPGWKRYVYRVFTTLLVSPPFWTLLYVCLFKVLQAAKYSGSRFSGYWKLFKLLFGIDGLISSNAWVWILYFRPGYHPWEDDNSEALASAMRDLVNRNAR